MNCIVIDDEPLARKNLEEYIGKIPNLELLGSFEDPLEAMKYLRENDVDLIFSDIQMPEMDGIAFLKSLKSPPFVVFITAHPSFAIQGFDLDVLDFIIKPLSFVRFLKAVNKAHQMADLRDNKNLHNEYMKIKDRNNTVLLKYNEIYYIEGMKDYVRIISSEKPIIVMYTMKQLEMILPPTKFVRIQKSYIINIEQIKSVDAIKVRLKYENKEIPIGLQYRAAFKKKLNID